MSELSVTERRLRPILDAVAARNWKQALQQCEKWQKKGEKSDRFLALKASILVNQPDKSQVEKGKSETLHLCHREPAITDIEALYQLQDSLKHLSLHKQEGPKLWERAIAARPNDKDLLTTLLNGSISDGNWMSAQKAAMALRKAYPKERQYEFWNMLLCHLIHQDTSLPQKDRDLFGRLAFMLMTKSAESIPENKDEMLTPGKAISTPDELALMIKIFITTGHSDEALKALQSSNLGLESRIADLDPQFVFTQLLEALTASDDQDKVFAICKDLVLSGSPVSKQHLEDDRIWKIIQNLSQKSAETQNHDDQPLELAKSVLKSHPKCRAAYLAYFNLAHQPSDDVLGDSMNPLVLACSAYYENFKTKPFCFGDLEYPLSQSREVLNSFNAQVRSAVGSDIEQVFDLKLKHVTVHQDDSAESESALLQLATDAVKLHKRLSKEKAECPEMMLLASTILLRLALTTQNHNYKFQATYMLDRCYVNFNEYYPTAVRLVQLLLTQGQISSAFQKFGTLAVKNMQWETIGHLLLNRISTLHPLQSGTASEETNPLLALDAGLSMLDNSHQTLDKAIREGLKYGSYSNVIDSVGVKSTMVRSMNRQIFVVEERRIQRCIGVPLDIPLDPYPADMVDQRDFSFIPYFGMHDGRFALEKSLTCGPLPKKLWLLAMALHDHLATHLKAELGSQALLASQAFGLLESTMTKLEKQMDDWNLELTEDESSCLGCHRTLARALLVSKNSSALKQSEFDSLIDKLRTWLKDTASSSKTGTTTINNVETPTWKFLHTNLTLLETLQSVSWFASVQSRRTKTLKAGKTIVIVKEDLQQLQDLVASAEQAIHEKAKKLKDGISASGSLGKLVDAAAGRIEDGEFAKLDQYKGLTEEYAELVDEAALEAFCGRMKDSWEDALDGILRIKVKVIK